MAFSFVPVGTILPFGGATAPSGWLLCNGASVSIASYPALSNAIGVLWGNPGGGSFNLPNGTGAFFRGIGTNGVHAGVATVGAAQVDQLQGHITTGVLSNNALGGDKAIYTNYALGGGFTRYTLQPSSSAPTTDGAVHATASASAVGDAYYVSGSIASDGSNGTPRTGAETRPNSFGVNYIIKI